MVRSRHALTVTTLALLGTLCLWGCEKQIPVNQADQTMTPAETQRNEPPPRDENGRPKNENIKTPAVPSSDPRDMLH